MRIEAEQVLCRFQTTNEGLVNLEAVRILKYAAPGS